MGRKIIGEILLHQFRVESYIASGGMGTVYRVWDLKRNVFLAMKALHTDLAEDPSMYRRFEREARALQRLAHPNIVPFYGLYRVDDFAFLLQRYIDGPSLKDILRERKGIPMPITELLVFMKAISSALGYAHAKGVVHCDVKPGNIMVDSGGTVYVTDFGIARHADSTTTTFAAAGTPAYMAPEQISEDAVGAYSDVYAMGVMLYEMLTGRRPFVGNESGTESAGPTAAERIRYAHMHLSPPDPRSFNPTLSKEISLVLLLSLSKTPEKRFPSAMDYFNALCNSAGLPQQSIPNRLEATPSNSSYLYPTYSQPLPATPDPQIARRIPILPTRLTRRIIPWLSVGLVMMLSLMLFAVFSKSQENLQPTSSALVAAASVETGIEFIPPTNDHQVTYNNSLPTSSPEIPMPASPSATATREPTQRLSPTPSFTLTPTDLPPPSDDPQGKIVFTCQIDRLGDRDQLCVMNADGSGFRQLTNDLQHQHWYASFAPDGKSIVFSSNQTGNYEIYEMDLDGRQNCLTNGLGMLYAPAISPDGQRIVFTNQYSGTQAIWIINRNGTNPHELYRHPGGECVDPVWSPDGQKILMACGSAPENRQLYAINIDGSGLRQVIKMDGIRGRSDWSPDGNTIATYAGVTWNREIYLLNLEDGTILGQITNGGNNLAPSFSPDGHWITFTSYMDRYRDNNGCEIYLMRIDGSKMIRLTDNNYCDWQPRWGP
jgi:TolB protein